MSPRTQQSRLVIFDVDGTLVDSQAHIVASMEGAFAAHALPMPDRAAVLSIVGLSLPEAFVRLVPEHAEKRYSLSEAYKDTFAQIRLSGDVTSPLYPGALEILEDLSNRPDTLLGIATGKSRRGLDHLMEVHGWGRMFQTVQVADHHPSKPHPSMVLTCLEEVGLPAAQAVMVGDTSYDMEMARAAGVGAFGVGWGYHDGTVLRRSGARRVLVGFEDLPSALAEIWENVA